MSKRIFNMLLCCFICTISLGQIDQDLKALFEEFDDLRIEPNQLNAYFFTITDNYSIKGNRAQFLNFFAQVEASKRLMENPVFRDHYFLFKARAYKVAKEFDSSYKALNNISEKLNGFTLRDSLSYTVVSHITTMKIGLYHESIKFAKKIKDFDSLPSSRPAGLAPDVLWLMGPAYSYYEMDSYENAIRSAKEALPEILKKYPDDHGFIMNRLNNIGVYFNNNKQPDSALAYFNEGLTYLKSDDFNNNRPKAYYRALVNGNKAQSYILKGDYDKAIPLLEEDVEVSRELDPQNASYSLLFLAECHLYKKDLEKATDYLQDYYKITATYKTSLPPKYKERLFVVEAALASQKGNLVEALDIKEAHLNYKDSVTKVEKRQQALALQTKFDFEENQKKLLQSKFNENAMKSELDRRNVWIFAGLAVLLIFSVALFTLNRSNKKQRLLATKFMGLNQTIAEKNETIQAALVEKETLLKEIHHRVKNNLQVVSSLLNLQSKSIDNDMVSKALQEGQARVKSMALVHQRLYETDNYKDIVFEDYIGQLVRNLITTYRFNEPTDYSVKSREIIDIDLAVPLGLLVNEIVTNSLKHFDSDAELEIRVNFTAVDDGNFSLDVSDNGKGFDVDAVNQKKTLGVRLMYILANQLDGNVEVDSRELGTHYNITIPKTT